MRAMISWLFAGFVSTGRRHESTHERIVVDDDFESGHRERAPHEPSHERLAFDHDDAAAARLEWAPAHPVGRAA